MKVTLKVGGTLHQGWERVQISRSIYTIAGTFELSLSPVWESMPQDYALLPGEECTVSIENETVITGFIDAITSDLSSTHRNIQVCGRDKTADLVDSSSLRKSRVWQNAKFETIARALLSEFKVSLKASTDTGAVFPTWGIGEEPVFDNLSRLTALRQLILISDRQGGLIATHPKSSAPSALIRENEVLSARRTTDWRQRFNRYITRIQNYGALDGEATNLKILAQIKDQEIVRYRPLLISQDGEIRQEVAAKRLEWEKKFRQSKSNRVELTLLGWVNSKGSLWDFNEVISLHLPSMGVSGSYLITGVRFSLGESGMKTNLECEGIHAATVDPTIESRQYNLKKVVEQDLSEGGE